MKLKLLLFALLIPTLAYSQGVGIGPIGTVLTGTGTNNKWLSITNIPISFVGVDLVVTNTLTLSKGAFDPVTFFITDNQPAISQKQILMTLNTGAVNYADITAIWQGQSYIPISFQAGANGNVGIGYTNPVERLSVLGNIYCPSNIQGASFSATNALGTNVFGMTVFSGFVQATNPVSSNVFLGGSLIVSTNITLERPQYIDLPVSSFALGAGANTPAFTLITGKQTGYMGYDTTPDFAYGNVQMPHNIAVTNSLYPELVLVPHIHWTTPTNAAPASSNVTWRIAWTYTPKFSSTAISGTNTITVGLVGVQTNAGYHMLSELCRITNNTAAISDDLRFRISREASASNDVAGRVCLMYLDIHTPVGNKTLVGSRTELTQ